MESTRMASENAKNRPQMTTSTGNLEVFRSLLGLLCHKFLRLMIFWQHGHRGRVRAIARAIAMRTDVMEFGT
jgi:hypothetical protein